MKITVTSTEAMHLLSAVEEKMRIYESLTGETPKLLNKIRKKLKRQIYYDKDKRRGKGKDKAKAVGNSPETSARKDPGEQEGGRADKGEQQPERKA